MPILLPTQQPAPPQWLEVVANQVAALRLGILTGGTSPLLEAGEHVLFTRAQFSW